MVARVSRMLVTEPDRVDGWLSRVPDVAAHMRTQRGFISLTSLVDRATGECIGITLWETAEDEKASRAMATLARGGLSQASGVPDEAEVKTYEVTHHSGL